MADGESLDANGEAAWAHNIRLALSRAFVPESEVPRKRRELSPPPASVRRKRSLPLSTRMRRKKYWLQFLEGLDPIENLRTFEQTRVAVDKIRFDELEDTAKPVRSAPHPTRQALRPHPGPVNSATLSEHMAYWDRFLAEVEASGETILAGKLRERLVRLHGEAALYESCTASQVDSWKEIGGLTIGRTAGQSQISVQSRRERAPFEQSLVNWDARLRYWRQFIADAQMAEDVREPVETLIDLLEGRSKRPIARLPGPRKRLAHTLAVVAPLDVRITYWSKFLISAESARESHFFEQARTLKDALIELEKSDGGREMPTPLETLSSLVERFGEAWVVQDDEPHRPLALKELEELMKMRRQYECLRELSALHHSLGAVVAWYPSEDPDTDFGLFESLPPDEKRSFGDFENYSVLMGEPDFYPGLLFAAFRDRRTSGAVPVAFAFDTNDERPPHRLSGKLETIYKLNSETDLVLSPDAAWHYMAMAMDFALYGKLRVEDWPTEGQMGNIEETLDGLRMAVKVSGGERSLGLILRVERKAGRLTLASID